MIIAVLTESINIETGQQRISGVKDYIAKINESKSNNLGFYWQKAKSDILPKLLLRKS